MVYTLIRNSIKQSILCTNMNKIWTRANDSWWKVDVINEIQWKQFIKNMSSLSKKYQLKTIKSKRMEWVELRWNNLNGSHSVLYDGLQRFRAHYWWESEWTSCGFCTIWVSMKGADMFNEIPRSLLKTNRTGNTRRTPIQYGWYLLQINVINLETIHVE